MDEQNSLRIAALTGEVLTRDRAEVDAIMHSPERSLGQKLDALQAIVDAMRPGAPRPTAANSVLVAQDRILRQRVLATAAALLRRAPRVGAPEATIDALQAALADYQSYVQAGGQDDAATDAQLRRAEALYAELRADYVLPFIKAAERGAPAGAPFEANEEIGPGSPASPGPPPTIETEQDFDRLNIRQLAEYVEANHNGQFDISRHNSVEDVRKFAKAVWRNRAAVTPAHTAPTPMAPDGYLWPAQTPYNAAATPMAPDGYLWPAQTPYNAAATPMATEGWPSPPQTPAHTTMAAQGRLSPPTPAYTAPTPLSPQSPAPSYSWETRVQKLFEPDPLPQNVLLPESYDASPAVSNQRKRRARAPPSPSSSDDEPDHESDQKRRRQEDKSFLRLKALELSKYAGVNERMEKIVQVTKAMQSTFDYCSCENTLRGTPVASTFVNLLRRLNTFNLSHVEMTVNFYELLYPLTLYNDESNRIVGYIFAATNYFQNCAKNFGRMRAEFNAYGPFAQIDSMVMFVIKFNFLCDLQAFFGKIDGIPTLGQPSVKIHTVLVMRDKIVKLAFSALQYDVIPKTDNRRDPKHLQRLIQLMNADFNI